MDLLKLIIDYHKDAERQGPGSVEATKKALRYLPKLNQESSILDIGCGTGAQTIVLAENTNANIIAIDMLQPFLDQLKSKIKDKEYANRIDIQCLSMDKMNFPEKSFDVIWSEGAIYNIGFEKGLSLWKKYIKNDGYIVISEISWLTATRPKEIENYWLNAYSEIDTIENKLATLERCGYLPITHFVLGDYEWIENYYKPMIDRSEAFLKKYNYAKEVRDFIDAGIDEADMYQQYKQYYSYVFYITKKSKE